MSKKERLERPLISRLEEKIRFLEEGTTMAKQPLRAGIWGKFHRDIETSPQKLFCQSIYCCKITKPEIFLGINVALVCMITERIIQ